MSVTLRLYPGELAMFRKLPAELQREVTVVEEEAWSLETEEELAVRSHIAQFPDDAGIARLIAEMERLGPGKQPSADGVSDTAMEDVFFTMGVRGMTQFIHETLFGKRLRNADEVAVLADMTDVRHDLLRANAAVS
jgi:hypothetical protein